MAIKANASSQGGEVRKKFVGVGSFRVLGVNPTKAELEKFLGREISKDPEYLKDKKDAKDNDKPYKQMRVTFMIQADEPNSVPKENKATRETNAALTEPYKDTISFFIDSRYFVSHKNGVNKVQVVDKYGRFAWVTDEQYKNRQIPIYSNGPAKLDKDYRAAYRGEEDLTKFILNYLNVTPIDSYNKNTGEWVTNPNPEDCEGRLDKIKDYFTGDISELKEYCTYIPTNCVKLLVAVQTNSDGTQYNTMYSRMSLRNGSKSYTPFFDSIAGNAEYLKDMVFSNDPTGVIENIKEYKENVKETDLKSAPANDPFAEAAALPEDDLPFNDSDPFAGVA